tara:strand:- start:1368 stop:1781 length:414 start_codon:yes stop_codon:yes gene_type:complete
MFNSFLRFLLTNLPAQEVHAHGGSGSTYNKRKRARKAAKSGASGGGTTPKTDAKKMDLVRKHSRLALTERQDIKARRSSYKDLTSPTSRRIVSNFQLQRQTTEKDYSKAVANSIRRSQQKMQKKMKSGLGKDFDYDL